MQKETIEVIRYIGSLIVGVFIAFISLLKWKTGIDFRVSENEKDIKNLKIADTKFVQIKDFDEIKQSLKDINKQLFEIAKNIPVCAKDNKS